jgi:hypothetical protein
VLLEDALNLSLRKRGVRHPKVVPETDLLATRVDHPASIVNRKHQNPHT